jgi:ribose/xylose/arabinose/galactoside ABC-type transport system permease subunit
MKNKSLSIVKSPRLWILVVVMLVLTLLQQGVFLTGANMKSVLFSISIYGIMVCGSIFPILLGGIDLSVGAVAAASGAFTVVYIVNHGATTSSAIIGILGGLAIGLVIGLIQGLVISLFNVPAFLVTLAFQYIIYGVAQLLTKNNVIPCMKPAAFAYLGGGRLFGIPFSIYILAIMAVISYLVLGRTVLGRSVYAVGGNPEASRLSGIKSRMISTVSYMISSLTAALAGIVLASMNQQAIAKAAQGYDNYVITALVIGGVSLMGGEGAISGAIWGAFLVGVVSNGLRLMGVASEYHGIVKCIIIVVAVAVDANIRYKKSGMQRSSKLSGLFRLKGRKQPTGE